ncbi:MAG: hypothetical protein H6924_07105 [Alphaproteobacteria bacterium]|nr:hypothetical protein [Alphaproteobacteria bacterium]
MKRKWLGGTVALMAALVAVHGCDGESSDFTRAEKIRATAAQRRCSGYWSHMNANARDKFQDESRFITQCRQAQYAAKCVDGTISFRIMGNCGGHGGQALILHFPDA